MDLFETAEGFLSALPKAIAAPITQWHEDDLKAKAYADQMRYAHEEKLLALTYEHEERLAHEQTLAAYYNAVAAAIDSGAISTAQLCLIAPPINTGYGFMALPCGE